MVRFQPGFGQVFEPSVVCDFVWGQVVVKIENGFVSSVFVIQANGLFITQKKIVRIKLIRRLVDF